MGYFIFSLIGHKGTLSTYILDALKGQPGLVVRYPQGLSTELQNRIEHAVAADMGTTETAWNPVPAWSNMQAFQPRSEEEPKGVSDETDPFNSGAKRRLLLHRLDLLLLCASFARGNRLQVTGSDRLQSSGRSGFGFRLSWVSRV